MFGLTFRIAKIKNAYYLITCLFKVELFLPTDPKNLALSEILTTKSGGKRRALNGSSLKIRKRPSYQSTFKKLPWEIYLSHYYSLILG